MAFNNYLITVTKRPGERKKSKQQESNLNRKWVVSWKWDSYGYDSTVLTL